MAPLWKWMALAALLIGSLGMTAAPASASAGQEAVPAMSDCPGDDQGGTDANGVVPDCAMGCSAALPATDPWTAGPRSPAVTPDLARLAISLWGIQPDIATPPPRRS